MEQLGMHDGHMTRFGSILRDRKFTKRVKRVFIDEAQNVYTAGIPKHGQPAFHPAYGRFNTVRLLFPKATSVLAFSATLPPHMMPTIRKQLGLAPDYYLLQCTSNQANIMYATHQVVGSLSDFQNLGCVLPLASSLTSLESIPLTIIFHDSIKECSEAAMFLDGLLPITMQGTGIVRHYHSLMSQEYAEQTYQAFQRGACRVLHTCGGMESGIDFNQADIVIQYGIPSDETKTIQRGG
jgi:superfamily II DNA/RNA helicase